MWSNQNAKKEKKDYHSKKNPPDPYDCVKFNKTCKMAINLTFLRQAW